MTAPREVASATPKDVVGIVASATRTYTLFDGTFAAVKRGRLAGATAMAVVVSTSQWRQVTYKQTCHMNAA